jgi:prophage tail gpP-like protein
MSALVIDAVVRDSDIHVIDQCYVTKRKKFAAKCGDGTALKIRIEPEEDAVTYAQFKYLFGFVFRPVAEFGHTEAELCLMAKAQFMPDDGRTSLTQLSREEMDAFTKQAEQWLRTSFPDAYLLYDNR